MTECNLLLLRETFRKTGKKLSNNVKLYCMQKKEKRNTKKNHKESSKSESLETRADLDSEFQFGFGNEPHFNNMLKTSAYSSF